MSSEVVVIGAGPAGLSAAVCLSRLNISVDIYYCKPIGGQLLDALRVNNLIGINEELSGREIIERIKKQLDGYSVNFIEKEIVDVNFQEVSDLKLITSTGEIVGARTVIISTGKQQKSLQVKNMERYWGHGLSACVSCDGVFYKNKIVGVVGSGDAAAKAALFLSEIAKKVYIFIRGEKSKCNEQYLEKIKSNNNIEIKYNTTVEEIYGENNIERVLVNKKGERIFLDIDGLFIFIGSGPNTEMFKRYIKTDKTGYIITDTFCRTNIPGVFACGDVQANTYKQASIAIGNGYTAGMSAFSFLKEKFK